MNASGYCRQVGLFSAAMLVAGSMIGSGIFLVSAETVRTGRTWEFLLMAWLFAALLTVAGALSYGELAGIWPRAGGQYAYLREIYGPMAGFVYGWTAFLVIETGGIAAVAVGFGKYLGAFLPWASESRWVLGPFTLPALHWGPLTLGPYELGLNGARFAGIALILAFSVLNLYGVRLGTLVQNFFTVAKLGSLAALVLLGLLVFPRGPVDPGPFKNPEPTLPFLTALLVAQTGCLFACVGWEYVTNIAAEVVEPGRTIPRALLLATVLVCGLYLLVNGIYLKALGPGGIALANDDRVGAAALEALVGPLGGLLMAGAILVSMAGWMNGTVLSTSRVFQAMAEDGLFLAPAARLNGHGVPGSSLGLQALWACLLATTGSYGQLLDYSLFAALLFYVANVAGVFVARWRFPLLPRPYRVWGHPVLPGFFLLGGVAVLGALLAYRPAFTWPGLLLALLGVPVYFWTRRGKAVQAG